MVNDSIHIKRRIYYCLVIPITIIGWIVLVLSLSWSITQLQSRHSCKNKGESPIEYEEDNCQKLIIGAVFNILLSVIIIGYCIVSFPFIWYLLRVVQTSSVLSSDNSYTAYREPVNRNLGTEYRYRESFLPSYRTATMTREDTTDINSNLLIDESMVADGYSTRN